MLDSLFELTGSKLKALDVLYVKEHTKPVSRIILTNEKLLDFLKKQNLAYSSSDFKIQRVLDKTRNYSDKGIVVGKDQPGHPILYISQEKKLAEDAKIAEKKKDHEKLGELLGYPKACSNFYQEHEEKAKSYGNDFTVLTFQNSKDNHFPWENNTCLRMFDIGLLSHFPCNFSCKESQKIARNNLKVLREQDEVLANQFVAALHSCVFYIPKVGVYVFQGKGKDLVSYQPKHILASRKNEFLELLKRKNRITLLGKNHFLVGETEVKDEDTYFGVFS